MASRNKNRSSKLNLPIKQSLVNIEAQIREGVVFQNAGQLDRAQKIYERILKNNPDYFDALHLLGVIFLQREQLDLAISYLNKAISINPTFADAVFHRGLVYKMQYKLDQALIDYTRAIELNPSHQNALLEIGVIYESRNRLEDSLFYLNKVIQLNADHLLAHLNYINVMRRMSRFDEALSRVNALIEKAPTYSLAYSTKAMVYCDQHKLDQALEFSDKAIKLGVGNGELGQLFSQRGIIYRGLWELEKSELAFKKAIALSPNLVDAYSNLGLVMADQGRYVEAISVFEKGLSINPNHIPSHFNLAMVKLTTGDYLGGFTHYEWRKRLSQTSFNSSEGLEWSGKEWLGGKTILIRCEQGMGDTIQFARYATILSSIAGRVILQVQAPLMSIMSSLEGNISLVQEGGALPAHDFYCLLMSLPHLFGTEIGSIPSRSSYLRASPEKVLKWRAKLEPYRKKRIGLVWSGGFRADRPDLWSVNDRRNMPFKTIAEIMDDRFDWFSLQKGEPAESELSSYLKIHEKSINLVNFANELNDFSDTAALIENLDLVISVDTSTAHLAAALGKPTWILNRFDTCWRWLLDRSDSPWYPTLRLFRQATSGDWGHVIADVKECLKEF